MPKVEDRRFIGARIYRDKGSPISSLACNGEYSDWFAGDKTTVLAEEKQNSYWKMGSVYVHSGCQLHVFQKPYYEGKMVTIKGPVFEYDDKDFGFRKTCSGRPCVAGFIVECGMVMPNCVPSDEWTSVAYLDNSGSSFPTTFTYEYEIGTEWSTEISQGFHIDVSVTQSLQASFFKIFEASVSVTFSTGYNWQHTSYEARSEVSTFNIETEIPAGKILKIEQARGVCGNSAIKTEMFKTTEINSGRSKIFYQ